MVRWKSSIKLEALKRCVPMQQLLKKRYGLEMAEKIQMRIDQITAASSVEYLIQYHIGRCHPLHHNRKNQFGMDLVHPMRLVFEKNGADIQIANIIEIVDYH